MRICFCPGDTEQEAESRLLRPAWALGEREFSTCALLSSSYSILRRFDAVVCHRFWLPSGVELLKRLKSKVRIVLLVDEHVLGIPDYLAGHAAYQDPVRRASIESALRLADALVVPSQGMKQRYSGYCDRIRIIPGCLPRRLPAVRRGGRLRVGWFSSPGFRADLSVLAEVLPGLARAYPEVEWVSPTAFPFPMARTVVVEAPSPRAYLAALRDLGVDVGIHPLQPNDYNRFQDSTEVLEASAAGIPFVASDIGQDPLPCRDGVSGFLARTPEDWRQALGRLLSSEADRRLFGRRAAAEARARASERACVELYRRLFSELLPAPGTLKARFLRGFLRAAGP